MTYLVNEIFLSIQGEGYWTGRPAVFVRFSRCNLWSGLEQDRHKAICTFCDTDFTDYIEYELLELVAQVEGCWNGDRNPMVIFTGGEPALQLDRPLVEAFRSIGYYTAIETNGTRQLDCIPDWICVSPKTPRIRITHGDELKLVYPQTRITPNLFCDTEFEHHWLSPMDGPDIKSNTKAAYTYCLKHPKWRLNIQTHKMIGVR
jgi:7-carboxy-7-deazaguanine synthase